MIRVGVVGATGYTALELLKILVRHPEVNVTVLTSRDPEQPHLSQVHPSLRDLLDLRLVPLDTSTIGSQCDVVFCCLPHAASAEVVGPLLDAGLRVIDFSADYRLSDVGTFEQWYSVKHPDPNRVGNVAYGIPELFGDAIRDADLVANPGCFPSSALLPLAPLLRQQLIEPRPIIVDSKTGVSGAGRKPNLKFHFPECNESVSMYGVGTHRHLPEIDQIIKRFCDADVETVFTPHLISMDRGIFSTIYATARDGVTGNDMLDHLADYYRDHRFVRISDQLPATKNVAGTNFCDITVKQSRGTIVIASALDNMIKGASGAAVQNLNVMFGFDQTTALL
jgi:N-acetyl-gamma-glutamyl-phosphate reductase